MSGRRSRLRRVVTCYDISDDRRRGAVARLLLDQVDRVQLSGYDGWADPSHLAALWAGLRAEMEPDDLALMVCQCPPCARRSGSLGPGSPPTDPRDGWVV